MPIAPQRGSSNGLPCHTRLALVCPHPSAVAHQTCLYPVRDPPLSGDDDECITREVHEIFISEQPSYNNPIAEILGPHACPSVLATILRHVDVVPSSLHVSWVSLAGQLAGQPLCSTAQRLLELHKHPRIVAPLDGAPHLLAVPLYSAATLSLWAALPCATCAFPQASLFPRSRIAWLTSRRRGG